MLKLLQKQIVQIQQHQDLGVRFTYFVSLQRAILQTAASCAIEYCDEFLPDYLEPELAEQMLSPADGTPLVVLDRLIPLIRQHDWSACATGWYPASHHADEELKEPLVTLVERWVAFRNNRPGHGVVDLATIKGALTWFPDFTRRLLEVLVDLIPRNAPDGLRLETPQGAVRIQTLLLVNGCPIVIRRIMRRGSCWKVQYQTLDFEQSAEGSYDLSDKVPLVRVLEGSKSTYLGYQVLAGGAWWRPTVLLPKRTTTSFCGRNDELNRLEEWFADEDSRACLVWGEGGIGKTTIVLEFLNGLLESPRPSIPWRPDIISFYSAKQTRWGPNGLEYLKGIAPAVADAVRTLVRVLEDRIDRKWYDDDPQKTIDRAVQLFTEVGIVRTEVLLVLDNTETLARTLGEEDELARLITRISARLCRVLITSRRREKVEAYPLRILPMGEETGVALLQKLAEAYGSKPLQVVGEATLRRISRKLAGRPLLLDVFAHYASRAGQSLDSALRGVLQEAGNELGEFLFEDAWQRIQEENQRVFLALSRLGDTIDGQLVGWVCGEVGVPHDTWLEAFEETRFGSIMDYGSRYDIHLDSDAHMYLNSKLERGSKGVRDALERVVDRVSRRYNQFLKAVESEVSDRVSIAFRTAAAKAAKIAANAGRLNDAERWYEEATKADPANAALWERFAWFLAFKVRDLERAQNCATEARRIDSKDSDCMFTSGMIAARTGEIASADSFLRASEELGKPAHLVAVQRARARVEAIAKGSVSKDLLFKEAEELLAVARRLKASGWLYEKHMAECGRLSERIARLRERIYGRPKPFVERRRKRGHSGPTSS